MLSVLVSVAERGRQSNWCQRLEEQFPRKRKDKQGNKSFNRTRASSCVLLYSIPLLKQNLNFFRFSVIHGVPT